MSTTTSTVPLLFVQEKVRSLSLFSFSLAAADPKDCEDVKNAGNTQSGVYTVKPPGLTSGIQVYCDMQTDGGGWLVSSLQEYVRSTSQSIAFALPSFLIRIGMPTRLHSCTCTAVWFVQKIKPAQFHITLKVYCKFSRG